MLQSSIITQKGLVKTANYNIIMITMLLIEG